MGHWREDFSFVSVSDILSYFVSNFNTIEPGQLCDANIELINGKTGTPSPRNLKKNGVNVALLPQACGAQ